MGDKPRRESLCEGHSVPGSWADCYKRARAPAVDTCYMEGRDSVCRWLLSSAFYNPSSPRSSEEAGS